MANIQISTKRIAITKANAQMVIAVGVASFVTVFCLIAAHAVYEQNTYDAKVVTAKEKAHTQLKANISAFNGLVSAYKTFDASGTNVLGGSRDGTGDKDGSNSRIVLDALPSSYDFPALASSLEKILTKQNYALSSISGTDDQLTQQANKASATPAPVEMPFSFTITGANYEATQKLMTTLESSIRPLQIDTLSISGGSSSMSVDVAAHTFYQPGKSVNISSEVVK